MATKVQAAEVGVSLKESWTIRHPVNPDEDEPGMPARIIVGGDIYELADAQYNALRAMVIGILDVDASVISTKAELEAELPEAITVAPKEIVK